MGRSAGREMPFVEAADLTVRLFSTAPVHTLELVGKDARVRLCARCPAQALLATVTLNVTVDQLTVNGRTAPQVFVDGEVKAVTGDGRVAQVAGRWSFSAGPDGVHARVQVPSERYVMAVLQAEASGEEPFESLKALAVVARSFALQNPQRHGVDGLCDSTHCQALRFGPVPAQVREAVEATDGETLWLGGSGRGAARQVSGYFSQDCGGMTEDAAALWGGERRSWLRAQVDPFCTREPALWHAELSVSQVRDALRAEGITVPEGLGAVRVARRDASGRVAELELEASDHSAKSQSTRVSAPTLRFALDRAYGWNELRSDAYRVTVVGGRLVFDGKGHGHGVGLCQAGARAMAAGGKNYREVLAFYFPGTTVQVLQSDAGWAWRRGNGWMLRAVRSGNEWVRAGDAAWAKARSLFAATQVPVPTVTVYPTTELFRQGTGEPGWELAATQGSRVALQPAEVILTSCKPGAVGSKPGRPSPRGFENVSAAQSACVESLLEHEFLHVLVEAEAAEATPLWLREGLVELLAGERCMVKDAEARAADLEQLENGLRTPASWAESQRAHAAACGRVRGLVQRYGLAAVGGWLPRGVPASMLTGQ